MKSMEQGSGDGCLQPCLFGLNRGYEFNKDFAFSRTSSEKLLTKNVLGGGGGCYRSQERFWYRGGAPLPRNILAPWAPDKDLPPTQRAAKNVLGEGEEFPPSTPLPWCCW